MVENGEGLVERWSEGKRQTSDTNPSDSPPPQLINASAGGTNGDGDGAPEVLIRLPATEAVGVDGRVGRRT